MTLLTASSDFKSSSNNLTFYVDIVLFTLFQENATHLNQF